MIVFKDEHSLRATALSAVRGSSTIWGVIGRIGRDVADALPNRPNRTGCGRVKRRHADDPSQDVTRRGYDAGIPAKVASGRERNCIIRMREDKGKRYKGRNPSTKGESARSVPH